MLADLLDRKRPQRRAVSIPLDPSMVDRLDAARRVARIARLASEQASEGEVEEVTAALVAAEEDLAKAEAEWESSLARFMFEGLGRRTFEALIVDHPPTKEQRDRAKASGSYQAWNVDSFPAALISACLAEPRLSTAEVRELWDSPLWNQAELAALFEAAITVCQARQG